MTLKNRHGLRRSGQRVVLAALVGALVLSLAALGAAADAGTTRASTGLYPDPIGDSRSAPDISGVSVTSAPDGLILFRINTVNLPSPADVRIFLLLDTDMNEATGEPDTLGGDFIFMVDESDQTYGFARWDGTEWADTPYSTVNVSSSPRGVTISINRSELGNTTGFNFWTRSILGEFLAGEHDDAPDDGTWNYFLEAGGPRIDSVLVATNPGLGPKAGKPFTVTPAGLRIPNTGAPPILPQPDSYRCAATLAGKPVVGAGTGRCTWKVPKKARGKQVRVVLTVTYQGATKSISLMYRVS